MCAKLKIEGKCVKIVLFKKCYSKMGPDIDIYDI